MGSPSSDPEPSPASAAASAVPDVSGGTGDRPDTDPSFFTVAGSGILHDVGPAHGSGYRDNRA